MKILQFSFSYKVDKNDFLIVLLILHVEPLHGLFMESSKSKTFKKFMKIKRKYYEFLFLHIKNH